MKRRDCKIPGYRNLYAEPVDRSRFVIMEYAAKPYIWTHPLTRDEAMKLSFDIPETCR